MAKVTLDNVVGALEVIANWTQAVQAELLAYKGRSGTPPASLEATVGAVAHAVEATAVAWATARTADVAQRTYPTPYTGASTGTSAQEGGAQTGAGQSGTRNTLGGQSMDLDTDVTAAGNTLTSALGSPTVGRGC